MHVVTTSLRTLAELLYNREHEPTRVLYWVPDPWHMRMQLAWICLFRAKPQIRDPGHTTMLALI